jgi:hypothetical protein
MSHRGRQTFGPAARLIDWGDVRADHHHAESIAHRIGRRPLERRPAVSEIDHGAAGPRTKPSRCRERLGISARRTSQCAGRHEAAIRRSAGRTEGDPVGIVKFAQSPRRLDPVAMSHDTGKTPDVDDGQRCRGLSQDGPGQDILLSVQPCANHRRHSPGRGIEPGYDVLVLTLQAIPPPHRCHAL